MLLRNLHLCKMSNLQSNNFSSFVKNSKKIVGAGLNYKELLKTGNVSKPEKPIIFLKPSSSYIQEGQDIIIPEGFAVNEEIELGVIIGKKCKNISEREVMDCIAGYCLALDLTATSELTEARKNGLPWCIGKSFDTACPVSRFITKEEIPDLSNVDLWIKINEEIRQKSNTCDLIFPVPKLISFISKYMTLEPNDLILTGTPPGMSQIKDGDCIVGGISNLLKICFSVKAEKK